MSQDTRLNAAAPNAMLRDQYACDDAWIAAFLAEAQVGHIATRWEEQPFITPTLFWYSPANREIYFHSNITGRMRANIERHPQACFEASRMGKLLPSNAALEFAMQYESVVAFGEIRVLEEKEEQLAALYGLIDKYFPGMKPGAEYRPITDKEQKLTAVYAFAVRSWSGKRNWKDRADQIKTWPALSAEWFER
ncbi:MAG: pyridoxamine 5'-phosphate oxidase family protein [Chloroflexi bacterium]|nr:pyridoxamine 5'-phosphate oxidase family protein [Chloroflexota bacterium]